MNKFIFTIPFIIFLGCGTSTSSDNTNNKTNQLLLPPEVSTLSNEIISKEIDPLFKELNTGFPAGGLKFLTEDKNITWVDAVDLILDKNIETKYLEDEIKLIK